MNLLFAHQQIDTCNCKHYGKKDNCRRRSIRRIAAAVPVKHIVYISHYGIHACRIQIRAKQGDYVAVGLKGSDKSSNNQVKNHGGNHGKSDPRKGSQP